MNRLPRATALAIAAMLLLTLLPAAASANGRGYLIELSEGCPILVDRDGNILVDKWEYDHIFDLSTATEYEPDFVNEYANDFYKVYVYDARDRRKYVGLMDASGSLITEIDYKYIYRLSEDRFMVSYGGGLGVMDSRGALVLPFEFTDIVARDDGSFYVLRDDYWNVSPDDDPCRIYCIDAGGAEHETGIFLEEWNDLINCRDLGIVIRRSDENGLYGFMDISGEWLVEPKLSVDSYNPPTFDKYGLTEFIEDESGHRYAGVINARGELVIEPIYEQVILSFPNHILALSTSGNSVTIYDKNTFAPLTQTACDPKHAFGYGWYPDYSEYGAFLLGVGGRQTVFNLEGEALYTAEADEEIYLTGYRNKCVVTCEDDLWYIRNLEDGTVFGPYASIRYDSIEGEESTYYIFSVLLESGGSPPAKHRYGVIDHRGNIVVEPIYDSIELLGLDRLLAYTPEALIMLDFNGNTVNTFGRYDQLVD